MRFEPHEYQSRAIELMVRHDRTDLGTGLFLDPGMGKTVCALTAFNTLYRTGRARRMLVIAPMGPMYDTWQKEPKKWDHTTHFDVCVLHGKRKDRRSKAEIHVINPEGLAWLFKAGEFHMPYDVLCVDESTKFKHSQTKRFKLLKKQLTDFEFRWCLTGTLAPNGLMDIFGQAYVMDRGKTLGRYVTHFKDKYFQQVGYGGYTWEPVAGAVDEVGMAMRHHCVRLTAEDYLDMPDFMPIEMPCELPGMAMKLYKQVENDYFAKLDDSVVLAANKAVAGIKCRQIANGAVYDDVGDTIAVHDAKLVVLERIVEETNGHPLMVMYEFQHDRKRLEAFFAESAVCITGLKGAKLQGYVRKFNEGSLPVMLCHPGSVAGMNIHGVCSRIVWFSLPWNLEHYIQSNWRLYRQGQKSKIVFCYHIVSTGTLDEKVSRVLTMKKATQNQLEAAIGIPDEQAERDGGHQSAHSLRDTVPRQYPTEPDGDGESEEGG